MGAAISYRAPRGRAIFGADIAVTLTREPEGTVRLLPREEDFFTLFAEVARRNTEAAKLLRDLFEAPPDRRTPIVEAIKKLEHEADQVTHEVVNRLDRTFIEDIGKSPDSAVILESVIELGLDLHLMITAEGVETAAQHHWLETSGCHRLQGYLFSRPLTKEQLDAFLAARRPRTASGSAV